MMMRMKILVNYEQEYEKAVETSDQLVFLSGGGMSNQVVEEADYVNGLDLQVRDFIQLESKRPLYLYLAGACQIIYAENSTSNQDAKWLYSKVKQIRKRAEDYLL